MIIKTKKFKDVNRAPYNPRVELKKGMPEYEKLAKSIDKFEQVLPMVYNSRSGNLVGGHQTMTVLGDRGIDESQMSIVDLDDADEKALNIALNKISGSWDDDKLSVLLGELSALPDFDIELTGFDVDEVASLNPAEVVEDNFDTGAARDAIDEPVTKQGDIILLGRHRLMCGDSTSIDDIAKLMNGKKAEMCFIDPPYEMEEDISFLLKLADLSILLHHDKKCVQYIYENIDIFKHFLIGRRPYSSTGVLNHPLQHHTLIAVFGTKKIFNHISPYLSSIQDDFLKTGYEKSVTFINNMIHTYSNKNNLILDPFAGSGALIIYSEQLGRTCYSCEIDPMKCDVIAQRFFESTGIEPTR